MILQRLLNKKEIAAHLGITVRGVECLMARKAVPFFRLGNRTVRFDANEVAGALARMRVDAVKR